MEITVSKEKSVTILGISGHLDGQTYQDLINKARDEIEAGAKNILLDMGELTYISSAGLVSLHSISMLLAGESLPNSEEGWSTLKSMDTTRSKGMQKHLKLLNPRPEITSVLDMVGFSAIFETFNDRQKAVDSF